MRKRTLAALLAAAFALAACGSPTALPEASQEADTTQESVETDKEATEDSVIADTEDLEEGAPDINWYTYRLSKERQYDYATEPENYTTLATTEYDLLSLDYYSNPDTGEPYADEDFSGIYEALSVINEETTASSANFAKDHEKEQLEALKEAADKEYFWKVEDVNHLSIIRADTSCLSIARNEYVFLGGAHGETATSGYSFDPETGKRLTLSDVLTDTSDLAEILSEELLASYDEEYFDLGTDDLKEKVADLVKNGPNTGNDPGCGVYWYVSHDGVTFIFNQYDLASYAAGQFAVTLTLEDYGDLLDPTYVAAPDLYIESIPSWEDIELNDGKILCVTDQINGEYEYIDSIDITCGDQSCSFEPDGFEYDLYLAHTQEGVYLLLNVDGYSDWQTLYIVDLQANKLKAEPQEVGVYGASMVDPTCMKLSARTQILSTAFTSKIFSLGAGGALVPESEYWAVTPITEEGQTFKMDATMNVLDAYDSDTTHEETIKKGTVIHQIRCDDQNMMDVVTEDGRYIRMYQSQGEWPQKVDDTYVLDELLDGTIFAG